jgi:shikimate kinase
MNIYLVGMMGSGKTTIGNLLALEIGYNYIDTDNLIENKCKMSIADIIIFYGIDYFRSLETQVLEVFQNCQELVVSTGGGIILNEENIILMKNKGKIIYLETSIEVLKSRLDKQEIAKRPLLMFNSLKEIFDSRVGIYQAVSDITISCDDLTPKEICEIIIKEVNIY